MRHNEVHHPSWLRSHRHCEHNLHSCSTAVRSFKPSDLQWLSPRPTVPRKRNVSLQSICFSDLIADRMVDDRCEAVTDGLTTRSPAIEIQQRAIYSTDGTCGAANGGKICDPNSTVYKGVCCSVGKYILPLFPIPNSILAIRLVRRYLRVSSTSEAYLSTSLTLYCSHCGTGCQSGCKASATSSKSSSTPSSTAPRADGQCGKVSCI